MGRTDRTAVATGPDQLSPALEDCLEAVAELTLPGRPARVRDLARRLGVRMPTVTVALRRLAALKLVDYQPYGGAIPTPAGRRAGHRVGNRHQRLARFLTGALGIAEAVAQPTACRLEHAIDEPLLRRLEQLALRAGIMHLHHEGHEDPEGGKLKLRVLGLASCPLPQKSS